MIFSYLPVGFLTKFKKNVNTGFASPKIKINGNTNF